MGQIYVEGDAGTERILRFIIFSCSIIAVAVFVACWKPYDNIRLMAGKIDMMLKPEIIHMIMLL